MSTPRLLLARLRNLLARGPVSLNEIVRLVSSEMVTEVCSVYAMRPGDILELAATVGLRPEAVGRTRLRVGEGIIGLVAATAQPLNLPDAQNHPGFAYRPETGEEPYTSMMAVPVRRAGRTLGVLAVQNRAVRRYESEELDALETVAMLLVEPLAAFGASDGAEEGLGAALPRRFMASPLVPGLAIGPAVMPGAHAPRRLLAEDPDAEMTRLARAVDIMRRGLDDLITNRLSGGSGQATPEAREVLEAYRLVAEDPGWLKRVNEAIRGGLSAEAAVHRVAGELRDRMRRISDPYLRERLADLEDMAGRLLAALDGGAVPASVPPGAILLARRLGPAELLDWHARGIGGAVVEEASPAGHAAILARALGIPTVGGVRGIIEAAEAGDDVVVDADEGASGQVILRPEQDVLQVYQRAQQARQERRAGWAALRGQPSATRDGTKVQLMLNVGLALELGQLDATGAEGIGLFRTEIAMLARGAIADVAEQAAVYGRVLDAAAGRPVVFRTLDLGGDKLLPGTPVPEEENPAMGWRSLRIGLDRPALLRRQLRALLMAAAGRKLSVMFPMVATVAEFCTARAILEAEVERVRPVPESLNIGTMLEVPALMWQLPELLKHADFISVGTNDLMQFVFAADRSSPALAGRYDMLSPAMLNLLADLAAQARAAGVPLSVCGEAAARPLEAMTLVGLGVTSLSMSASSILPVKATLAAVELPAFRELLTSLRRTGGAEPSFREPIAAWAREHDVPV
ncbi:Phosphocarrier protein kinase/phosphorylase, nitrogen regulation associated [Rhodovastum atsumiense]|uniref:phosphoenolpyruvate--protein phosphotransferase n=1 Tax=Rhodovastum atsumiense TaxID=504468 RepID=A0A5M6ISY0_9PROT|nr:phosphoenolpyruvate--protein phosphotransferase [Rhodovastum atsumiense]KAA5611362.1 phosphoenolpyruvate--protein phosphotransferase [Rhodovastum atsumiense]CAH2603646.1 Phosphocarrier protein kinase/phosphorylase, nitrogen regulation associated [Rhodovastum atsumiense]